MRQTIADILLNQVVGHNTFLMDRKIGDVEYASLFESHHVVAAVWPEDNGPEGNITVKFFSGQLKFSPPTIMLTIVPVTCAAAAEDLQERYAVNKAEPEKPPEAPARQGPRLVWDAAGN